MRNAKIVKSLPLERENLTLLQHYMLYVNKFSIVISFFSGSQLLDFDFLIGDNIHDMELCGHFKGAANTGQRIAIWCPHNTVGRYVQVQIVSGSGNVMSPGKILVWGVYVN